MAIASGMEAIDLERFVADLTHDPLRANISWTVLVPLINEE